ncbi:hypothetical protein vseg_021115 [Gypsophila vaccaria]
MAQRALSHSWISPLPEINPISDMFGHAPNSNATHHFTPETMSCTTDLQGSSSAESFNPVMLRTSACPTSLADLPTNLMMFPSIDMIGIPRSTADVSSMLLNISPAFTNEVAKVTNIVGFGGPQQQFNGFPVSLTQTNHAEDQLYFRKIQNQMWNNTRSVGFPGTLSWDSAPCPSELSTSISSNKCYL